MSDFSNKRAAFGSDRLIYKFWIAIWVAEILATLYQLIEFPGPENLICIGIALASCGLTNIMYRRYAVLSAYPFSSLTVLGFGLTRLALPLVFISLNRRPLIYEMHVPVEYFSLCLVVLVLFLIAHVLYRTNGMAQKARDWLARRFLTRLAVFTPPSEIQIWLIGGIGLVAQLYLAFYSGAHVQADVAGARVQEGAGIKFLQGLTIFDILPFIAVFPTIYGGSSIRYQTQRKVRAVVFFVLLIVASMGTNSRTTFMGGMFTLAVAYWWGCMTGILRLRVTLTQIVVVGLALALLAGPLKDLSNAMIIARGTKNQISSLELTELTIETYFNKQALTAAKEIEVAIDDISSHEYLDSPFLNRFLNVRVGDNCLYLEQQIGTQGRVVLRRAWLDHFLTTFPKPMIILLHLPINKDTAVNDSFGDEELVLATGESDRRGSFSTADFIGIDYGIFRFWFLPLEFLMAFLLFIFLDALSLTTTLTPAGTSNGEPLGNPSLTTSPAVLRLAPIGLLFIGSYITTLALCESSVTWLAFLVRYWWQAVILYALIFRITRYKL